MNLNELLDKTSNWDKDERYMATSDLCSELQKDIKIDATMERRICASVLKQLDDQSNDVQSIAVKCLGVLLKKVHEEQVGEISEKLCSLILDGKDELRDIYSIGLKTLLKDVPDDMGASVCDRLTKRLLSGVAQDDKVEVKLESFENLTDLLKRFGQLVHDDHANILEVALKQLSDTKAVVRKRAAACLAALATSAEESLLEQLFSTLLKRIDAAGDDAESARTLIQTIGTISRAVGGRLGRHLDEVVPVFIRHIGDAANEEQQTEEVNELRENCFQGLESFVLRCSSEIAPHLGPLLQVSMTFAAYDPNYAYDDDDEMDGGGDDEDEAFEDDDYGGDDDDDDTSWKVRRAAIKLCAAIVTSRPQMLDELFSSLAPALIKRFKEREENVRVDVIETLTALLRTSAVSPFEALAFGARKHPPQLAALVPAAVEAGLKQLTAKSKKSSGGEKPKAATYGMLRALCAAQPGLLGAHSEALVKACEVGLKDKSQPLKLDAAALLRCAVETHGAEVFAQHVPKLIPIVACLVKEDWYKLIAEGLRLVATFAAVARPNAASASAKAATASSFGDADLVKMAQSLYSALEPRLYAHDIDHEIKECAIAAVGALATRLGDKLVALPSAKADSNDVLGEVIALLGERLKNESTRLAALRALGDVASSALSLDVSVMLRDDSVAELSALLRQQSRLLKQTTLETLRLLIESKNAAEQMSASLLATLLSESAPLVSDDDLHLAHLAIHASLAAIRKFASSKNAPSASDFKVVCDMAEARTLPAALALAASPLLQGVALSSVGELFEALCLLAPHCADLSFASLSRALGDAVCSDAAHAGKAKGDAKAPRAAPKQAMANVGLTLAVLCANADAATRAAAVRDMLATVSAAGDGSATVAPTEAFSRRHVATLTLGELGRRAALQRNVWDALFAALAAEREDEHKAAAACALGLVTAGGASTHLEPLLAALEDSACADREYVLLVALKEVCVAVAASAAADAKSALCAAAPRALKRLLASSDSADEPTRNMVAECVGALVLLAPEAVAADCLDVLLARARPDDEADARARWTGVAALKHAASAPADRLGAAAVAAVAPRVLTATALLDDPDLSVKRQAVVMLNACAYHAPQLLPCPLGAVVATVAALVDLRLERVVDLGPFKHKVDDGLPIRKAALAAVSTLIDAKLVDCSAIVACVATSLLDKSEDVQIAGHLLVVKLSAVAPDTLSAHVTPIVDALDKTVNKKTKDSKAGTEAERAMSVVRSALKAAIALSTVRAAHPAREFIAKSMKKEKLMAELIRLDPKLEPKPAPAALE
ncbi:armadillo-type protein [Pelagophyceae sp. CCMP2097]|nr:armadillo-type protein [Pelagophyceae sp. CCMP2097]